MDPKTISTQIQNFLPAVIDFGMKILGAIAVLLVGLWVIGKITKILKKIVAKNHFDKTLSRFLVSLASGILKVLLGISVIGMLGIQVTSFIAILGAAGLAVGMALSGTLQNFAGGVMLLIFRPYKTGDFVELAGHSGTVKEIQIFNTILTTGDNKTIFIPNSEASSTSLVNYSIGEKRRVDLTFGIGYGDDIDHAKKVLHKIIEENTHVISKKDSLVVVSGLGDSAVELTIRVWVKASDYWPAYFDLTETVKKTFDREKISFPFPQRDVHLFAEKGEN